MSITKRLMPLFICSSLLLTSLFSSGALAEEESPKLGQKISAEQAAVIDQIIQPNGDGLPVGEGTVAQGKVLYDIQCIACHAEKGAGQRGAPALAGGDIDSSGPPLRTVGSYWPYSSTLFDFIRRAMPANAPKSLSDDEVYALTAYVLNINGIVGAETVLNASNLADIKMPNSDGFLDQSGEH